LDSEDSGAITREDPFERVSEPNEEKSTRGNTEWRELSERERSMKVDFSHDRTYTGQKKRDEGGGRKEEESEG